MNQHQTSQYSKPVDLTPKQANIYAWGWQQDARFRDAVCGRRFGKTFLGKAEIRRAARLIMTCGVSVEDEIWYGAPTFKQAKRVFWRRLKACIPTEWMGKRPNETECIITLATGHVIRVVGLDNYDDLRGSGLFFFLGDEWADCKPEAWTEVIRPMLSTCKYTIDGVEYVGGHALRIGTPKGFNHFYKEYRKGQASYQEKEPDHKSWMYTTVEGGNVPQSEIEAAQRALDPKVFRQEYQASFETYEGVIYYTYCRIKNNSNETIQDGEAIHIGMDFNIGKMAAVVHVVRGEHVHAVDEITNAYDTNDMIRIIKERYWAYVNGTYVQTRSIYIYPDASGGRRTPNAAETDITLLRQAGFVVMVNNKNPPVRDRINSMNGMFCNAVGVRRYYVNAVKCPDYVECLEQQPWGENGEPNKKTGKDHKNDAAGYYISYTFPINKPLFGLNSNIGLGH